MSARLICLEIADLRKTLLASYSRMRESRSIFTTTNPIADLSPRKTARMAGFFYLIFVLTTVLASYIRGRFILSGDAVATANNIVSSQGLFRVGFVTELVSAVFFLLAAWALYVLLKPVNKDLALLFLLLNLGGVGIECLNMLNLFTALQLLLDVGFINVFSAGQLQAQALICLNLYKNGFIIAQIFYGTWLLPLGYLVFKSSYLPRLLGILLMFDFFGVLFWFFQFFLFPSYAVVSYPSYVVGFIAEVSLSLWLLMKSVKK